MNTYIWLMHWKIIWINFQHDLIQKGSHIKHVQHAFNEFTCAHFNPPLTFPPLFEHFSLHLFCVCNVNRFSHWFGDLGMLLNATIWMVAICTFIESRIQFVVFWILPEYLVELWFFDYVRYNLAINDFVIMIWL